MSFIDPHSLMRWFRKFISKSTDQIKLSHNGIEYAFTFENDPLLFDPLDFLSEIKKTHPNSKSQPISLSDTFINKIASLPARKNELPPTATCNINTVNHNLEVDLYKYFESSYPVSEFVFSVDGIEMGSLLVVSDSGATARKYACCINSDFIEEDLSQTSWKWIWTSGEWILIQKSTKTKIWRCSSSFQYIENLVFELSNNKNSLKSKIPYVQKVDLGQINNLSLH